MRCPIFVPRYNQVNAISLACRTGLKECQDLASKWFSEWMLTNKNRYTPARSLHKNSLTSVLTLEMC